MEGLEQQCLSWILTHDPQMASQGVVNPVKKIGQCLGYVYGILTTKQASETSPKSKLIIVATHTHGNHGGPEIAMLQLVADP